MWSLDVFVSCVRPKSSCICQLEDAVHFAGIENEHFMQQVSTSWMAISYQAQNCAPECSYTPVEWFPSDHPKKEDIPQLLESLVELNYRSSYHLTHTSLHYLHWTDFLVSPSTAHFSGMLTWGNYKKSRGRVKKSMGPLTSVWSSVTQVFNLRA